MKKGLLIVQLLMFCMTLAVGSAGTGCSSSGNKRDRKPFAGSLNHDPSLNKAGQALARLQNSVVYMKIYLIMDTALGRMLPEAAPVLQNVETGKLYYTSRLHEDVSIMVNIPPGTYFLRGVQLRDETIMASFNLFPSLTRGQLDFRDSCRSVTVTIDADSLHYAGDWSVLANDTGQVKLAPPEYTERSEHFKKAREGLLAYFVGTRWGRMALRYENADDL